MNTLSIDTQRRDEYVDLTDRIRRIVRDAEQVSGAVVVYVPHTTAGVTINENADPDVIHDTLRQLDEMVPWRQKFYQHAEGNSAAHVKASMVGSSVTVIVEVGELVLGRWQGIFLCEFDGPRTRQVHVKLLAS